MFLYLLVIPAVLLFIHYILNCNERALIIRKIPGIKDTFIFGNALEAIKSPVDLFSFGRKLANENCGIYRFWGYPYGAVNIYNPEDIEIILSSMKYHEKSVIYSFLKPWLQEGLLISNGAKWQNRRKILTPAFHFNVLRKYFTSIEENANRLVESLEKTLDVDVDVVPIISGCTLNSICETAMGTKLSQNSTGVQYKSAIYELGNVLPQRFVRLYLYIDFIFNISELGKRQMKNLSVVHNFTRTVIKERKEEIKKNGSDILDASHDKDENNDDYKLMYTKKKRGAMLDLLIAAEKEGSIDSAGIQEEVDTFMFEVNIDLWTFITTIRLIGNMEEDLGGIVSEHMAGNVHVNFIKRGKGHDTTASGLTYCLMLLANHPEVQDKIVMELTEIFGDSKRAATVEDQNSMRYLERCIKESLRLYPPVPFISRQINDKVILSNYEVPAGTLCHIHIYDLHRQENLYPNPTKFDPDRFLPEAVAKRHHYAYIPFSAGPRNCIGQKFAMMEMKSVVSGLLRNYQLLPITNCQDLHFQGDLVLRNTKPVYVKFARRSNVI